MPEPNYRFSELGATWYPLPHFSRSSHPRYVILHAISGFSSCIDAIKSFESCCLPRSYHYIIDYSDDLFQCVSEDRGAYACENVTGQSGIAGDGVGNGFHDGWWDHVDPALVTISVALVFPQERPSRFQELGSYHLIDAICRRWKIPKRKADASGGITGHHSIDPINHGHCPGTYPWGELFERLALPWEWP